MTSRVDDNSALPFYMKKINNKQSLGMMSDKSLEMNNYADSKFITKEGFQPKKSFNKVVNLNLLNSNVFWNKNILKKLSGEGDNDQKLKSIENSMNFYSI